MSLTLEELQALTNASLTDLFAENRALFDSMAREAYDYTRHYVREPNVVRIDDVVKVLEPALAVTTLLGDYLAERKLNQKYWIRYFGDYILDQLWRQLET
jgi:hypothetical protein